MGVEGRLHLAGAEVDRLVHAPEAIDCFLVDVGRKAQLSGWISTTKPQQAKM